MKVGNNPGRFVTVLVGLQEIFFKPMNLVWVHVALVHDGFSVDSHKMDNAVVKTVVHVRVGSTRVSRHRKAGSIGSEQPRNLMVSGTHHVGNIGRNSFHHAEEFVPDVLQSISVGNVTSMDHHVHGAGLSALREKTDGIGTVHSTHVGNHTHLEGGLRAWQCTLEPEHRAAAVVARIASITHIVSVVHTTSCQAGHNCRVNVTNPTTLGIGATGTKQG
mmetsp:Transcript_253/g.751  ORF Transcript_253/g.751 Transcript_253/m.751 type:complete len:218 (-) Transcript_253:528-1181(-)